MVKEVFTLHHKSLAFGNQIIANDVDFAAIGTGGQVSEDLLKNWQMPDHLDLDSSENSFKKRGLENMQRKVTYYVERHYVPRQSEQIYVVSQRMWALAHRLERKSSPRVCIYG